MYSDQGSKIVNDANGTGWYAVGGLVGFAGAGKRTMRPYQLLRVRLYHSRHGPTTLTGGGVGGLVGATNMNITCTAVTILYWSPPMILGIRTCVGRHRRCVPGHAGQMLCRRLGHRRGDEKVARWCCSLHHYLGGRPGGRHYPSNHGELENYMGATTNALMTVQNSYALLWNCRR